MRRWNDRGGTPAQFDITRVRAIGEWGSASRHVGSRWEEVGLDLERKQVKEAFERLPAAQRQTLQLAYFEGYTQAEIARRMDVPLGTVKGRLRIGLEKMRAFLQARGVET